MIVERETAGFALPFAAGIAVAVYIAAASSSIFIHISSALTLAALTCILACRRHIPLNENNTWTIIIAAATVTGLICGLTANEISVSSHDNLSLFARLGASLETAADNIPFSRQQTNAFLKAVLTGERSGMSPEITEAFRKSGASHILALSGLHLGVIYLMISRLLSLAGFSRMAVWVRSILTIFICGIYTLATGASPSIVRAFIFIALNESASLAGRYRSTGNILLTALVIQLCISPASIRSVGFQLSYAAMAGIAFIHPYLKRMWPEENGIKISGMITRPAGWMWNSLSLSIACQATTAPLAWIHFGTFPQYFLLTNLIALPLTGILIPSAAVTLILSRAEICPDLLVRLTEWLTWLLIGALEIIASM